MQTLMKCNIIIVVMQEMYFRSKPEKFNVSYE